jgi:hypothetical protein
MKVTRSLLLATLGLGACFAQTITTVAGTADPGFGGDGGMAVNAQLNGVAGLALDAQGNLYIHDGINIRVRKVTPSGIITTIAGSGDISETVEGAALQTGFISIYGIATLPDGTLYVADASGLQMVDNQGNLSFVVTGTSIPGGIRISKQGVFYTGGVTVIYQLNPDQSQTPVAGSDLGDSGDGGPAAQALFYLADFTTDSVGDIYLVDNVANRVRKFTPGGNINLIAGNGTNDFSGDGGPGTLAQLNNPTGVAVDVAGNVYISDAANSRVRRVTTDGVINTFAGSGPGDGSFNGDGGPAVNAVFSYPTYLAISCSALYVSDANSVRAIALTDPLIAQRGLTSTATGGAIIPAGATFQISGCNLAASTADGGLTPPLSLAGTSVTLNGVSVPVISVSPTRVVAQVPFGFPSGATTVTLALVGNGKTATAGMIVQ